MTARRVSYPLLILLLLFPFTSRAFVVATDREGRTLRWSEPEELRFVVYPPERDTEALPPWEEVLEAIEAAAAAWSDVEGSMVSMEIEVAPPGSIPPAPGYDRDDPSANVNAILFATEEWRHEPGAYAVTLRTYGSRSANLFHADIVVNAVQHRWEVLSEPARPDQDRRGPVDVQGVLTHEMGHALGFEHTRTRPSAMRATIGYGEIWMRELSETDLDGLRHVYSSEAMLAAGWEEDLGLMGCGAAPAGSASIRFWLPGLLIALGLTCHAALRPRSSSRT